MRIDLDAMNELAKALIEPMASRAFKEAGTEALRRVYLAARSIYKHISPKDLSHPLVIFRPVAHAAEPIDRSAAILSTDPRQLRPMFDAPCCVEVIDSNCMYVWSPLQPDVVALSESAIVYEYRTRTDRFWARGQVRELPNPFPQHASYFAVPSFERLQDALESYSSYARCSTCPVLDSVWHDKKRLFLANKPKPDRPEDVIRRSLWLHLSISLRGIARVLQEQNVDETRPVDIKVTYKFHDHEALIELKWLGKARNESDGKIAVQYGPARARGGAKQLAGYLDAYRRDVPGGQVRGYLTVIDARRWGAKETSTSISRAAGMYYEQRELMYYPQYHVDRDDFEVPIRMFIEPVCES